MSFAARLTGYGLGIGIALTVGACATEETSDSGAQAVTGTARLTAAFNTSDFNNVWRLEGEISYAEGSATVVLQNATQPTKPLIQHHVRGGGDGPGISKFTADVSFGDVFNDDVTLPAVGDCIAVKTGGGMRGLSDAEIRANREFGAFVYVSDPLSGAPKRPAWGVTEDRLPKLYATVAECLNDPDRGWAKANPNDKLDLAINISGAGNLILRGTISTWELAGSIALVNVSDESEPLVLRQGFRSTGKLDVAVSIPSSVKTGDCIAVKNVSGGRGFSNDEARAKEEFGAFRYSQAEDAATFRTAKECLASQAK